MIQKDQNDLMKITVRLFFPKYLWSAMYIDGSMQYSKLYLLTGKRDSIINDDKK